MSVADLGAWIEPGVFEFFEPIPNTDGSRRFGMRTIFAMYPDLDPEPLLRAIAAGEVKWSYGGEE